MPGSPPTLLRGYLHLAAAIVAPYALLTLLFKADSPRETVAAAIFGSSLILLYTTSATLHLAPLGRRLESFVRRIDHSMIYVFIAGAYAPFALVVLGNGWGIPVLSVVGGLAVAGVMVTLAFPAASRWLRVGLYLTLGWVGIVAISKLTAELPWEAFALLLVSGLLFSVGGATYAIRRPDPFPRVFGFHEMFHAMQVAATALIYLVVVIYVLPR